MQLVNGEIKFIINYSTVNSDNITFSIGTTAEGDLDPICFSADKLKEVLVANGLVAKKDLVKILGRGEFSAKLNVTADAFSKSAIAAIEKAGGKTIVLGAIEEKKEEAKPKAKAAPKAVAKKEEKPAEDKADDAESKEG